MLGEIYRSNHQLLRGPLKPMPHPDLGVYVPKKDQQKLSGLEGLYVSGDSYLSLAREGHQSDVQLQVKKKRKRNFMGMRRALGNMLDFLEQTPVQVINIKQNLRTENKLGQKIRAGFKSGKRRLLIGTSTYIFLTFY